jgi:hypothetical protein
MLPTTLPAIVVAGGVEDFVDADADTSVDLAWLPVVEADDFDTRLRVFVVGTVPDNVTLVTEGVDVIVLDEMWAVPVAVPALSTLVGARLTTVSAPLWPEMAVAPNVGSSSSVAEGTEELSAPVASTVLVADPCQSV